MATGLLFRARRIFLMLAFLTTAAALPVSAQAFQVPALTGPVVDNAGIIPPQDRNVLDGVLRTLNERGHAQLQILTVQSLNGEPIEQASIQVTDKWRLGTAKKDNGILMMIATKEHKIRIEVGQGLEGDLPDVYAKRIIADVMIPYFKRGQLSEGVKAGVSAIISVVDPQMAKDGPVKTWNKERHHHRAGGGAFVFIIWILFIALFMGRSFFPFWWIGGGGFGGGDGFGGGWGGGGGGFSGGGASGGW